jgi:hypothetical protein
MDELALDYAFKNVFAKSVKFQEWTESSAPNASLARCSTKSPIGSVSGGPTAIDPASSKADENGDPPPKFEPSLSKCTAG